MNSPERPPAPVSSDPPSRGIDREFRLPEDEENVIRINQRQPKGLPHKLAEFVPVAGINQPDVRANAEAFVRGSDRSIELQRLPDHPVDPNAIAVIGTWVAEGVQKRERLGYLPAKVAADLAGTALDSRLGATVKVMYLPRGERTLGIRLDVWGPRRATKKPVEQPLQTSVIIPTDAVRRNLLGIELESQGLVENAIQCYEQNVREGFDGNHPYDRLAVIYRRRGETEKELVVLRRAIEVFEQLRSSPRSDVAPKLEAFRRRYEGVIARTKG